ncbi:MAG TPA: ABC transporter permease [Tepidisphaeraceae bacterium]|nr:ABC transporter permease [Tepidisphaeraceae bacterium]
MSKSLIIAWREYIAAVRTKSFVIGIVLMPIFMFGSVWVQKMATKIVDVKTQRIAIIDRTPNQALVTALQSEVENYNRDLTTDETGKQIKPRFELERVAPSADTDHQRLELADRVRAGELLALVEIGSDVVKAEPATQSSEPSTDSPNFVDANLIRYSTARPTYLPFRQWFSKAIIMPTIEERSRAYNIPGSVVQKLAIPPVPVEMPLAEKDSNGEIFYPKNSPTSATSFIMPTLLGVLMMLPVMIGASPLTMNVIEEKQLRIAEVVLGSVRPFDLMLGKLLGGAGVSLTLAVIYLSGSFFVAHRLNALQFVTPPMVIAFVIFTPIAVLLFGSIFVAAGAAVTNIKESQAIISPLILLLILPMMLMPMVIQNPTGTMSRVLTFFPLTAPLTVVARMSVQPPPSIWEVALAALTALLGAAGVIWMAGRIFRVGILSNSKPASFKEAIGWVMKG